MCEQLPSVLEEECFETDEADGERDEVLGKLIHKAARSHLLSTSSDNHCSDSDDHADDLKALQWKLQQKEEDLVLAAEIGHSLLTCREELISKNVFLEKRLEELEEQLLQLKHDQTHYHNYADNEGSETEDETDSAMCGSIKTNCSEIAVDEFLRKRVDSLESSNQILQSDMDVFRQTTEKEIEMMKFRYDSELATTRKLIKSLEERVDANDIRMARSEQENEMWKDKIMDLVNEMQELETQIAKLRKEIQHSEEERYYYKEKIAEMITEKDEHKRLIDEMKKEISGLRLKGQPRVLRHVSDPLSPYIQPGCFTQELEESHKYETKTIWETHITSPENSPRTRKRPVEIVSTYDDRFGYRTPMGQPGRPGSKDLEMSLRNLQSRLLLGDRERMSGYIQHSTRVERRMKSFNAIMPIVPDSRIRRSSTEPVNMHQNLSPIRSSDNASGLLHHWRHLGTPDMGKIFQPQSGIWIKGSVISDVFIEEEFEKMEFEEDDSFISVGTYSSKEEQSCTQSVSVETISTPRTEQSNNQYKHFKTSSADVDDRVEKSPKRQRLYKNEMFPPCDTAAYESLEAKEPGCIIS